ncbi:hypothetical protein CROQUDRAFT_44839, partial [Cronartium quercuum f. sp. fusiforme G11]
MIINYNPFSLWSCLEEYHSRVTEARLKHIDMAIQTMVQLHSDLLKMHVNKFSTLLREYYKYKGDMSSSQVAQILIRSLKPSYKVT